MHKIRIIFHFLKANVLKETHYLKIFLLLIFSFTLISGNSQIKTIGTPSIQNYPKSVYQAATQNWGITQDQNEFIYFANNDGVLRFDGIHWDLIEVSKSSPVRSVFADNDNIIYVIDRQSLDPFTALLMTTFIMYLTNKIIRIPHCVRDDRLL